MHALMADLFYGVVGQVKGKPILLADIEDRSFRPKPATWNLAS